MSATIVADNVGFGGDIEGEVSSGANNIVGLGNFLLGNLLDGTNGNQIGTTADNIAPLLAPLGDYGGPTHTMPPRAYSPAIDAVLPGSEIPGLETDQRGFPRLLGTAVDIGACESGIGNYREDGGQRIYVRAPGDHQFGDEIVIEVSTSANFTPETIKVSTLAGPQTPPNDTGGYVDAAGEMAQFRSPTGVAEDSLGRLFISDSGNHCIRMLVDGTVTTIAGTGSFGRGTGPGLSAAFAFPSAIAVGPNDNLYVSDTLNHRICKLVRPAADGGQWTVTTLAGTGIAGFFDGSATASRFNYPYGLDLDEEGNVYVADALNHRIRKVTPGGQVSTFAGSGTAGSDDSGGTEAEFDTPQGLTFVGSDIYVADRGNNLIRKIGASAVVTTFPASTAADSFSMPSSLAADTDGNLYVADEQNHRIRKVTTKEANGISAGTITTIAGSGTVGSDDGSGTDAQFDSPAGLVVNRSGVLIVADTGNHRIRSIEIGPLRLSASFENDALGGQFSLDLDPLPNGLGYGPDYYFRYRLEDGTPQMLSGQTFNLIELPLVTTMAATGILPTSAQLNASVDPNGISTDVRFEYSTDETLTTGVTSVPEPGLTFNGTVEDQSVVTLLTDLIPGTTYHFRAVGTHEYGESIGDTLSFTTPLPTVVTTDADNVTRDSARLNADVDPAGGSLAVRFEYSTDPDFMKPYDVSTILTDSELTGGGGVAAFGDLVYVSDPENHRIWRIDTGTGTAIVFAGSDATPGAPGFVDEVTGTTSRFDHPRGLVVDAAGNLYVADEYNQRIRKISPAGSVSTIAGSGEAGFLDVAAGGAGGAKFFLPTGITVDDSDNIYVADSGNHRIRIIAPDGSVATFAGNADGIAGLAEGEASAARFDSPQALAWTAPGDLLVADTGNDRIRRIRAGNVSSLGGDASFNSPGGVAVDKDGSILVADTGNHRIRRIDEDGEVTDVAGSGMPGAVDSDAFSATLVPATVTEFDLPSGIAVDDSGNDSGRIFIVQPERVREIARRAEFPKILLDPDETVTVEGLVSGVIPSGTLLSGTTYFFRAVGMISSTDILGEILSFTTAANPAIAVYDGIDDPETPANEASLLFDMQTEVIDFGVTPRGVPVTRSFTIENTGGWDLSVSSVVIAPSAGYLVSGGLGLLAPGESSTFSVTLEASNGGISAANITISSDAPDQLEFTFPVTGEVLDPPIVTTKEATEMTPGAATLNAMVDPMGSPTTVWFEYSQHPLLDGTEVSLLAGSDAGYADGIGNEAKFEMPGGLVTDEAGNTYVADTLNHRIRMVTPAGLVTTVAGSGSAGFNDATGTAAQFNGPSGVVLDGDGNLFVADSGNHRIRKITPGGVVTTYAGLGVPGFTEGVAGGARFHSPVALAIDAAGALYVADRDNGRIRMITPDPDRMVSTLPGGAGLTMPHGIAVDGTGAVFFTEQARHAVQQIDASGVVSVMAGSPLVSGFADPEPVELLAARFSSPNGLALDSRGNLYIADTGNNVVRKIIPPVIGSTGTEDEPAKVSTYAEVNDAISISTREVGTLVVGEIANSTLKSINPTLERVQAASGLTDPTDPVSFALTGLDLGATYYFRAIATNGGGSHDGMIKMIPASSSFAVWQFDQFGDDSDNGVISGPKEDPDCDGIPNLMEYAFGLDPHDYSDEGAPLVQLEGGFLSITYTRLIGASDLTYQVEWSSDLKEWIEADDIPEVLSGEGSSLTERVVVKVPDDGRHKFIRLCISQL